MKVDSRLAAEELARRAQEKHGAKSVVNDIRAELFDRQLSFIDDTSKYKAALCTRRAGKTSMWSRYCVSEAIQNNRALIRIWAVSRIRAKQLLWSEITDVCRRHAIKVDTNETELSIQFENGSEIRLLGADKDKEVQKKRGDKTWMEVILETQLFGNMLQTLVEDVADPCLIDERYRGGGIFCLEGTPGPLCVGYWYDVTGREDAKSRWQSVGNSRGGGSGWSCHRWSVLDNPFMPHAPVELARLKERRKWQNDNPTYIREWLGRWVNDYGSLFYKFDETRNLYNPETLSTVGPGWEHTLGWDLGSVDDMALVVWAFHPHKDTLYEAFSWKKSGALAKDVMEQIRILEGKGFNFVKMVADTGGGGRMYVEEVMSRYSYPFEAASKSQKAEHVRLFNDDLMTGHIKLMPNSPLMQEMAALPIDPNWIERYGPSSDEASGGKKPFGFTKPVQEDPRFANHNCFVAGTMITTSEGQRPIESIRVGDLVLTRKGFKPVTKAESTGFREVITRFGLTGTPEHPMWTENRGWQRLDEVCASDVVLYACQTLKQFPGTALSGVDTLIRSDAPTVFTTREEKLSGLSGSIAPFGRQSTERFQRNTTSTTKTRTRQTIASRISSVYRHLSTCLNTLKHVSLRTLSCIEQVLIKPLQKLLNGTALKKGEPGTKSTQLASCRLDSSRSTSVSCVRKTTSQKLQFQTSAQAPVTRNDALNQDWTTYKVLALSAETFLRITNTPNENTVLASVHTMPREVYALSVAEAPEYFANGLLQSNCDASLYSYRAARHYLHTPKLVKHHPNTKEAHDELEAELERLVTEKSTRESDPLAQDEGRLGDYD